MQYVWLRKDQSHGQSGQYAWFCAIAYMECATLQGIPIPCHINDCIKGYGTYGLAYYIHNIKKLNSTC